MTGEVPPWVRTCDTFRTYATTVLLTGTESAMSDHSKDMRCKLGKHHYVGVVDDNPEMRGQRHLERTRCGHVKDIASYKPMPGTALGGGGGAGGG